MRFRAVAAVACAAAVSVSVSACSGGDERVVVFAASSLTDVFAELETVFEAEHDGIDIVVSSGGSSTLATQIEQGAPVDVFAAADVGTAERVAPGGDVVAFATNSMAIVVEAGNPRSVVGLADLARDDLVVVLAAPEVPAGRYAAQALSRAGVEPSVDSYEQSVRAVASKVALGEADIGIVYATDVAAAGDRVEAVAIASEQGVEAVDAIVVLSARPAAREFVEFVLGDEGRAVLSAAGFGVP